MGWRASDGRKDGGKYLGDVISTDGRNLKNIKGRIAKGKGIVSKFSQC